MNHEQPPIPKNVESTEGLDRRVVPQSIAQHISTIETRKGQIAEIDDEIRKLEEQLQERRSMKKFFEEDVSSSQTILEGHQYWTEHDKRHPQPVSESALKKLD